MEGLGLSAAFWRGKRVLLTGHTGFKGVWATRMLERAGAEVHGFALAPEREPSLFGMLGARGLASSTIGDVADRAALAGAVAAARPQLVLHMAAQSLVRRAYREPVETFATNAMGAVHLLDALRGLDGVEAVLVVTTDKVYAEREDGRAFVEGDRLGAGEPYAASKAAAELATAAFGQSFFAPRGTPLATARGGNVVGGGDFSEDRLAPDIVRAALAGAPLKLRRPNATRPWQHVLDCLAGYFAYLEALAARRDVPCALNFGPDRPGGGLSVADFHARFAAALGGAKDWEPDSGAARETEALAIDASAARRLLGWRNRYSPAEAIRLAAEWYRAWRAGADAGELIDAQIASFLARAGASGQ